MIWQMIVAILHSNEQLKTEWGADTEKGCHKPAVHQKTDDNTVKQGRFSAIWSDETVQSLLADCGVKDLGTTRRDSFEMLTGTS